MASQKKHTPNINQPIQQQQMPEHDIHFKKLIENSFSGITLLDQNLKIIYRSPSAERIGGWNAAAREKNSIDDLTHPLDKPMLIQLLQDVLISPNIPKTCSFRSKHLQGHFIWLECTFTNMFNEPDINAIVCNFIDITKQKETEELLQNSINELSAYKYALDESAIVAITDQRGIIQHVNDNFCKISKYSKDELIGQDHRIINSSRHSKEFIKNIWTTIANGKVWKGELKNKAKDGSFYWVDTAIVPFLNNLGKPERYIAIRSDITERKLTQEKISENNLFIKTITDSLPALIAYWTADLHCLFANRHLSNWFNKTPEEVMGIHKQALLDIDEYTNCLPYIQRVLQGQPQSFERVFHRSDGKTIFTHTQYVPDIENGTVKGFYSLICDYTEARLAEVKIKEKNEQIENLLENITDGFIALNQDMVCTYVNNQIARLLDKHVSDIIGINMWELFPNSIDSMIWKGIHAALDEKKYVCNEDYYAPLNLWHENRIYPSGNGLSIFIRNITKRKQEESHLRLLESVITNTTDAVLITEVSPLDEPGPNIVYVNEAFTKMTGYTAEEVLNKSPRFLQGPKSDKVELTRLKDALIKAEPCEITTINYKKSGDEFWINFSVSPVMGLNGQNTHFIAIEKDVTRQKNEEMQRLLLSEAIAEALKERNTILESIGDAFFALDKNWKITYWNHIAEKVLFKARVEVTNYNLWKIFPEAVGSLSYQKYHEAVESNKVVHFEDFYPPLEKWFEVSAYPSANGLSVYFKEITERKNAEMALNILNESLQVQNQKFKEISWMQSHIIRAPLSRIMGLIPLLQDCKNNKKEIDQMLGYLTTSAKELDEVIVNITEKTQEANYEIPGRYIG